MERSTDINELAAALAKAQGEMSAASKDSANPFFNSKYADLASCWAAWREAGPKHGLALMQFATATEERLDPPIQVQGDDNRKPKTIHFVQRVSVQTLLVHSSGQWVSETLTVLVKDDSPQSTLSGETYCRRGSMSAIVGIAPDDDDDGNGAANHGADTGSRTTQSVKPVCPACGKSEFVFANKPPKEDGFYCWKKPEQKKFGCGHNWNPDAPPDHPAETKPAKLHAGLAAQLAAIASAAQIPRSGQKAMGEALLESFGATMAQCLADDSVAHSLANDLAARHKTLELSGVPSSDAWLTILEEAKAGAK
jgi:hypothetical protein